MRMAWGVTRNVIWREGEEEGGAGGGAFLQGLFPLSTIRVCALVRSNFVLFDV